MNSLLSCLITISLIAISCPAIAGNVLFVSDTNTDTAIPNVLTGDGHTVTVVTNDYANNNAALSGDLSGYCAVYWSTSQVQHGTPAVTAAISNLTNYVTSGGHVFVTGADGVIPSYNSSSVFINFIGGGAGCDCGYNHGPVENISNSLTTGIIDIRGITPTGHISDTDSLCGPLAVGTVGILSPTTGISNCQDNGAYSWTLRTLGTGRIAYVMSGNFGGSNPYTDEPDWTDTNLTNFGIYNAAVRNFAYNSCPEKTTSIPSIDEWGMIFMSLLLAGSAIWMIRRRQTA